MAGSSKRECDAKQTEEGRGEEVLCQESQKVLRKEDKETDDSEEKDDKAQGLEAQDGEEGRPKETAQKGREEEDSGQEEEGRSAPDIRRKAVARTPTRTD